MQTQASLGWLGPDKIEIVVTNRTTSAVAVGDVERLDNTLVDGDSTTNQPGLATSGLANIVVPLLGDARGHYLSTGIFGVVQSTAADNVKCRFRLKGYCDAVSVETTVVLATFIGVAETAKEYVAIATSVTNATDAAVPHKVIFIPLTARTGAGLTDGWFDGVNGFGMISSIKGLT
jgi:hypothetical protein